MPKEPFGVEVFTAAVNGSAAARLTVDCRQVVMGSDCSVGVDATRLASTYPDKYPYGPLLPLRGDRDGDETTVTLHAIVDGNLIEAIYYNRTAMALQANPTSEQSSGVRLFGPVGAGGEVEASLETWQLHAGASARDRTPGPLQLEIPAALG